MDALVGPIGPREDARPSGQQNLVSTFSKTSYRRAGITGTNFPYERGQIGEQVTKTGRKELIQVDFLNEYLLFEWRRLLARTCFLWLLMTALRLLSESDATFIAVS